jgi:hypothetical protein
MLGHMPGRLNAAFLLQELVVRVYRRRKLGEVKIVHVDGEIRQVVPNLA